MYSFNQYGFRKKHSTLHPLCVFVELCVHLSWQTGTFYSIAMFCDLRKAFDTRLIMEFYWANFKKKGIRGGKLLWFQDYLSFMLRALYTIHLQMRQLCCCLALTLRLTTSLLELIQNLKKWLIFIEPTNYSSTPSWENKSYTFYSQQWGSCSRLLLKLDFNNDKSVQSGC